MGINPRNVTFVLFVYSCAPELPPYPRLRTVGMSYLVSDIPPSTERARSINELKDLAKPSAYDPSRSFKDQLRAVKLLRDKSDQYRQDGDYESTYIYIARAATLIIAKLPVHPQYDILSAKQKTDLAAVESLV